MLGVLFLAIVVLVLAGHYLLVERPRRRAGHTTSVPLPLPLTEIIERMPAGVFLQPTFTWSRIRSDGEVEVGIHPLLAGLVGRSAGLELRAEGERIEAGGPLVSVNADGQRLVVHSPVSGRIVRKNPDAHSTADWHGVRHGREGEGWVYRLLPDDLGASVRTWMIGEQAAEWTKRRYAEIRDHLHRALSIGSATPVLADGGEIPEGVLSQLGEPTWSEFQEEFLGG